MGGKIGKIMQQNLEQYKEQVVSYLDGLPYITLLQEEVENITLFVNGFSMEIPHKQQITEDMISALCKKIDIYFLENYLNENNIEILIPPAVRIFLHYEKDKKFLNVVFCPIVKTVGEVLVPIPYRVQKFIYVTPPEKTDSEKLLDIFEEYRKSFPKETKPKIDKWPFVPNNPWKPPCPWRRNCPSCGIDISGTLSYSCGKLNCPVGLGPKIC